MRQCWCLRIWAWSPKVEAQILPQSWQGTAVLGFGTLFFLANLLSSRLCSRLLSMCFVPLRVAALQAGRSWAKACHSSTGMLQALRVDFSTSLYRFLCPPLCRLPVESSAWNSCFGSLLSSMRVTCPDHRSCAWFSVASMPVSSAQRRTPGLAHVPSSWHGELCEGSAGGTGPVSWYAACSKSKSRSRTGETVAQQLGIRSAWSWSRCPARAILWCGGAQMPGLLVRCGTEPHHQGWPQSLCSCLGIWRRLHPKKKRIAFTEYIARHRTLH